jgi:phosphatidylserine/phosphatidylglycerophosphate/cardiolipin synthase-like enzyme
MNTIPGTRVLFSPKGGISKELSRLSKAAKGDIAVAAYAFSSKYLGNALSEAFKREVKVRIILTETSPGRPTPSMNGSPARGSMSVSSRSRAAAFITSS